MRTIFIALIALWVAASSPGLAQEKSGPHTAGEAADVTVIGTIEVVPENGLAGCQLCEACSDCRAMHLVLRTRSGRVDVHLAPAWFLARLEFTASLGDVVTVIGSRTRLPKGRGVAAHEVHSGNTVFRLRDEHGLPLWRRMLTDARESACDRDLGGENECSRNHE
jgi:hypothetical protein